MQDKFDRIVAITDEFAREHLNDEYAQLIRNATAELCRQEPSPLQRGRPKTWACGMTHAIGMVNFLFDSSFEPYISASDLYKAFGVSASSGQSKSKIARDRLDTYQMDPNWTLSDLNDRNPFAWTIEVNGRLLDLRTAPREIQMLAHQKGLIPDVPGDRDSDAKTNSAPPRKPKKKASKSNKNALYVLDVFIIEGLLTEEFVKKNPVMSRTIEIKGSQTLKELHEIIFDAFDREDQHLYEFQIGGETLQDPNATRYGIPTPSIFGSGFEEEPCEDASKTTVGSLGLSVDDVFCYWFDFGDSWWHQIDVMDVVEKAPKGKYPRVTKREGASPPQYPDFD